MIDIKDIVEAEEERRAALTDEEREEENREREARSTKALAGFSDVARLSERGADLSRYSVALADIAAAPIGKVAENLFNSHNLDALSDNVLRDAEWASRTIGAFDLPDYTKELTEAARAFRELPSQQIQAALESVPNVNVDDLLSSQMDKFRDLGKLQSDSLGAAFKSLATMEPHVFDASTFGFSDEAAAHPRPFVPDDIVIESPLPKILDTLEETRGLQGATVAVMKQMHKTQTAHSEASLLVMQELHQAVVQTNERLDRLEKANERQQTGEIVTRVLQMTGGTLMLFLMGFSIWLGLTALA